MVHSHTRTHLRAHVDLTEQAQQVYLVKAAVEEKDKKHLWPEHQLKVCPTEFPRNKNPTQNNLGQNVNKLIAESSWSEIGFKQPGGDHPAPLLL